MDRRAQDLTEYALLLCMVAFVIYGWLPSSYSPALSNIWAKVSSVMLVLTGS
ncbi:MAG TPA: hypothetical protein VM120_15995 [Bryobacteraceae bacterium]|nr:hypothetical protein [Bryobacteraceae bacterium]